MTGTEAQYPQNNVTIQVCSSCIVSYYTYYTHLHLCHQWIPVITRTLNSASRNGEFSVVFWNASQMTEALLLGERACVRRGALLPRARTLHHTNARQPLCRLTANVSAPLLHSLGSCRETLTYSHHAASTAKVVPGCTAGCCGSVLPCC